MEEIILKGLLKVLGILVGIGVFLIIGFAIIGATMSEDEREYYANQGSDDNRVEKEVRVGKKADKDEARDSQKKVVESGKEEKSVKDNQKAKKDKEVNRITVKDSNKKGDKPVKEGTKGGVEIQQKDGKKDVKNPKLRRINRGVDIVFGKSEVEGMVSVSINLNDRLKDRASVKYYFPYMQEIPIEDETIYESLENSRNSIGSEFNGFELDKALDMPKSEDQYMAIVLVNGEGDIVGAYILSKKIDLAVPAE